MTINLQQDTALSARERGKSQRGGDILCAARERMHRTGDLQFSMRALSEQAGVSIATPYNLFGWKQNMSTRMPLPSRPGRSRSAT